MVQHRNVALGRERAEQPSLVPVAEPPDMPLERVLLLLDRVGPAELVVEGPQEGVLALRCGGEVGCTPVKRAVDQENELPFSSRRTTSPAIGDATVYWWGGPRES